MPLPPTANWVMLALLQLAVVAVQIPLPVRIGAAIQDINESGRR